MKKFTFSFKSLLVACGLLLGSANAWALTETFGESKATTKDTYIIGTSVNIHKDSNPSGAGPLAVFNSKTDKGIKLRTIQSTTPLTLIVNPGYKVTNVTINAYQNNKTTGTITCDSYAVDGASPVAFGSPVSIPLNVENASTQTLGTISVEGIEATSSIAFNFTNTGAAQNQIYAYIEVTYEKVLDVIYTKELAGWSSADVTTTEGTKGKWYNSYGMAAADYFNGMFVESTYGLHVGARDNSNRVVATLSLSHTANSIITLDAVWYNGYNSSDANTPSSIFTYGDFSLKHVLDSRVATGSKTSYTINGKETFLTTGLANGVFVDIHIAVNTYTGAITEFYLKNGEVYLAQFSDLTSTNNSFSASANYDAVEMSVYMKGSKTNAWTSLKSITISEQEQAVYSYTVNGKTGSTILKEFATGTNLPGSTIYYHYNQVLNVNGILYQAASDNSGYKSSFILHSDNQEVVKSYSQPATPITNLMFLAEAEDIFTIGTGSSADTRLSMGAGGYASSKTAFVTLPAGTYYMSLYNRCSGDKKGAAVHNFYKGEDENAFFYASGHGYNEAWNSPSFTLEATTTLYMQGGDNNNLVDWIYIYGTPSNEIVGAVDCSTYYLEDMTEKVTLKPGESYNYKFVNHNKPSYNVNGWNWVLPVYASGAAEPTIVLRQDNWEDKANSNKGCSLVSKGTDNVWDDFINEMNGATVDMTVNYTAGKVINVSCDITTSTGKNWAYTYASDYDGSAISFADNVDIALAISNSWAEVLAEGKVVNEELNTNMSGYKTFYNATTDYQVDEHTTIYKAAEPSAGKVVLTDVGGNKIIKAGQPVILHTSETSIVITPTATESTGDFADNALQVADGSQSNKYVLGYTSANGFGFYYYTATLPAGYIYLDGAAPGVKMLNVIVDGTATGVEAPDVTEAEEEEVLYNTAGVRVDKNYKGIVINQKGEKRLQK